MTLRELPRAWRLKDTVRAAHFPPLPPLWDGEPVEWGLWEPHMAMHLCDRNIRNPKLLRCEGCDILDVSTSAWGKIGRYRSLLASRCPECGHTSVYDERSRESWTLGPEDYGTQGSMDPRLEGTNA